MIHLVDENRMALGDLCRRHGGCRLELYSA